MSDILEQIQELVDQLDELVLELNETGELTEAQMAAYNAMEAGLAAFQEGITGLSPAEGGEPADPDPAADPEPDTEPAAE